MTGKKVQRRTIVSKEKINAAAWELFCQKGYYNTNTKEIAARAGISVGNFYNYYRDKSDVYNELAAEYLSESARAISALEGVLQRESNKKEVLENYVFVQMERAEAVGRFFYDCQALMQDDPCLREIFDKNKDSMIAYSEQLLERIEGTQRRASTPIMAQILYVMINGLCNEAGYFWGKPEYDEFVGQIAELMHAYVFGEE